MAMLAKCLIRKDNIVVVAVGAAGIAIAYVLVLGFLFSQEIFPN